MFSVHPIQSFTFYEVIDYLWAVSMLHAAVHPIYRFFQSLNNPHSIQTYTLTRTSNSTMRYALDVYCIFDLELGNSIVRWSLISVPQMNASFYGHYMVLTLYWHYILHSWMITILTEDFNASHIRSPFVFHSSYASLWWWWFDKTQKMT